MARVVACDFCRKTFLPGTTEYTSPNGVSTGKWAGKRFKMDGDREFKLVWGGFILRNDAEKSAERGGQAADICPDCVEKFLRENTVTTV